MINLFRYREYKVENNKTITTSILLTAFYWYVLWCGFSCFEKWFMGELYLICQTAAVSLLVNIIPFCISNLLILIYLRLDSYQSSYYILQSLYHISRVDLSQILLYGQGCLLNIYRREYGMISGTMSAKGRVWRYIWDIRVFLG